MINKEYSHKSFVDVNLTDDILTGVVWRSGFSVETLDTLRFHPDSTCIFRECNLDNCVIPDGCTVEGGTNKRFQAQADMEDWFIDAQNRPMLPINKFLFDRLGIPTDPSSIANTPEPVTSVVEEQLERFS